ncbi:MAG: Holliday junction resolvase [Alphaproteobacteria bacterium]|nr:Holliday junction resolvase [Alphaproteobacteria bacterium]
MKILGLDPGLRFTGWGLIDSTGNRLKFLSCGRVVVPDNTDLATRLAFLYAELSKIITALQPDQAAVEETFSNVNAKSTLKLGMARGVVMLAPAQYNIPVSEYSANTVKKTVVGAGHAGKNQVQHMVKMLLPLAQFANADAADALAIAICHAHHAQTMHRIHS